jgi:hypothetical protein
MDEVEKSLHDINEARMPDLEMKLDNRSMREADAKTFESLVELNILIIKTRAEVEDYDSKVPKTAELQSDSQKRSLHSATTVMYILFGTGWFLGILGKVLKVPALSGSAE